MHTHIRNNPSVALSSAWELYSTQLYPSCSTLVQAIDGQATKETRLKVGNWIPNCFPAEETGARQKPSRLDLATLHVTFINFTFACFRSMLLAWLPWDIHVLVITHFWRLQQIRTYICMYNLWDWGWVTVFCQKPKEVVITNFYLFAMAAGQTLNSIPLVHIVFRMILGFLCWCSYEERKRTSTFSYIVFHLKATTFCCNIALLHKIYYSCWCCPLPM